LGFFVVSKKKNTQLILKGKVFFKGLLGSFQNHQKIGRYQLGEYPMIRESGQHLKPKQKLWSEARLVGSPTLQPLYSKPWTLDARQSEDCAFGLFSFFHRRQTLP
jgi:hypothetical protein